MSYAQKDLPSQVRGDTWILKFTFKNENGTAIDISNNQYWLTLKDNADQEDTAAAIQVGPIDPDPTEALQGLLTIVADPEDTTNLIAKTYVYDLQEVNSQNEVTTLLIGKVKVVKDITLTAEYGLVIEAGVPLTPIEVIGSITKDITGFVSRTDSTITFTDNNRTLTLAPTGTSYTIYYRGKKYVITSSLSIILTNLPGGRYIRFNPTTLQLAETAIGDYAGILDNLLVAYVYWNGTKGVIVGDERHSVSRDTDWHLSQHLNMGAIWRSGGVATFSLNNQNSVGLSFTDLTVADEDIVHSITHNPTPNQPYQQVLRTPAAVMPAMYLSGTSYVDTTPSTVPWVHTNNVAMYNSIVNGVGSLSPLTNSRYVSYWIMATNDSRYPIKALVGNVMHQNQNDAKNEVFTNYGLPFPEFVPLYKVVLRYNTGNTGNVARVVIDSVTQIVSRQSTALGISDTISMGESYIDSGSFDTGTGILTLTGVGSAGATISLEGRYLTSGLISYNANNIIMTLPTADPLVAGALWNSNGTLRISSGS
jgi:hypothetical protein